MARMDVSELHSAAGQFEATAASLDEAVRTYVSGLRFGGATAGRMHVARGDALRAALMHIGDAILQWSRASTEIAVALRTGAQSYVAADQRAAARLG